MILLSKTNRGSSDLKALAMSTKLFELESMSLDDLWTLHEGISAILSTRIKAEKHELEKRLTILNRGANLVRQASEAKQPGDKPRRYYPWVFAKYRNPQTLETWSGRGKRPRWLVAAMKSGHKIEEFRINESDVTSRRRRQIKDRTPKN